MLEMHYPCLSGCESASNPMCQHVKRENRKEQFQSIDLEALSDLLVEALLQLRYETSFPFEMRRQSAS